MTDEEMKTALEKALESIKKLEAKNSELIDREKAAKKLADDAEEARDEAATQAAKKAGDVDTITASLNKKHQAELKKLAEANKDYESRLSTLLIDNTINEALAKNGVVPDMAPLVTAFLKTGAKMENGEATVNGVPLTDHIAQYFGSESARHVTAAPANTGGGATGSTAAPNTGGFTKETLTLTAFSKLANEDPAKADAVAIAVGSDFRSS